MSRFFFDILNGDVIEDNEGMEFPEAQTACDEALRSLPDMVKGHDLCDGGKDVTIIVRSEHGRPIYRATLTIKEQWLADVISTFHNMR
ncbi:DUF6894 family protein [Methylobacterium sp. E-066]|uniref:DUF6894 family protein n=1 Tax=Methylobacterium sp. E-066 TaxID=2836584 RepID=UPI001FB984B3|nr:hypothetical protein [Methylobacterium sp. E-066]MCJ2139976.1 hypothetical protein [Methylobacterium sp. E-066]